SVIDTVTLKPLGVNGNERAAHSVAADPTTDPVYVGVARAGIIAVGNDPKPLAGIDRVDHAPGIHQQGLQGGVADVPETPGSPLRAPAVGELEHPVAPVEAD